MRATFPIKFSDRDLDMLSSGYVLYSDSISYISDSGATYDLSSYKDDVT